MVTRRRVGVALNHPTKMYVQHTKLENGESERLNEVCQHVSGKEDF